MQPKKSLMKLSLLLLSTIVLSGCSLFQTKTETEVVTIPQNIPIQQHPDPIDLLDVRFYVVSDNNFDEFVEEYRNRYGDLVFFSLTVPHYENLSLNIAEIRRYIIQQKNIIRYYENSIRESQTQPEGE